MGKIITIHHECLCWIEISHPRRRNFTLHGQAIDGLLSSHFANVFLSKHKKSKRSENCNFFTHWIYTISEFTSVLSGIKMGVNIVV